jgi:hypothetical protein
VHDIPTRSRDRLPLLLALPYTVYAVTLFVTVALVALLVILPLGVLQEGRQRRL